MDNNDSLGAGDTGSKVTARGAVERSTPRGNTRRKVKAAVKRRRKRSTPKRRQSHGRKATEKASGDGRARAPRASVAQSSGAGQEPRAAKRSRITATHGGHGRTPSHAPPPPSPQVSGSPSPGASVPNADALGAAVRTARAVDSSACARN